MTFFTVISAAAGLSHAAVNAAGPAFFASDTSSQKHHVTPLQMQTATFVANGEVTVATLRSNPGRKLIRTAKTGSFIEEQKLSHKVNASKTHTTSVRANITKVATFDANGEVTVATLQSNPGRKLIRTAKTGSFIEEQKLSHQVNASKTHTTSVRANITKVHVIVALCILGGLLCISSTVFLCFRKPIASVDDAVHQSIDEADRGMTSQGLVSFRNRQSIVSIGMNRRASSSDQAFDEQDDGEEEQPITLPTNADTGEFANGTVLLKARAWKFNAKQSRKSAAGEEIGETSTEELIQMSNWRRRDFSVMKTLPDSTNNEQEKLGLLLISAGTGDLKLLAMLEVFELVSDGRTGTKAADVREMAQVELLELDANSIQEICTSLQHYDLAFKDDKAPLSIAEYREAIPNVLFPISITWKDESDITCTNIIAMESEAKRQKWMKALKSVMDVNRSTSDRKADKLLRSGTFQVR